MGELMNRAKKLFINENKHDKDFVFHDDSSFSIVRDYGTYSYSFEESFYLFLRKNLKRVPTNMIVYSIKGSSYLYVIQFILESKIVQMRIDILKEQLLFSVQMKCLHGHHFQRIQHQSFVFPTSNEILGEFYSLSKQFLSQHPLYRLRINTGNIEFDIEMNFYREIYKFVK